MLRQGKEEEHLRRRRYLVGCCAVFEGDFAAVSYFDGLQCTCEILIARPSYTSPFSNYYFCLELSKDSYLDFCLIEKILTSDS